MDINSFLGTPKWKILELLAENSMSPTDMSDKLGTSVAYVSQQLKLLEALGLVIKSKTGAASAGKPRAIYSLSKEILSLAILANGWSSKKILSLTDHHLIILRIWLVENISLHKEISRVYFELEDSLEDIKGIFFLNDSREVIIVSDSKVLKSKSESLTKISKSLVISILSKEEFHKKNLAKLITIYDPLNLNKGGFLK